MKRPYHAGIRHLCLGVAALLVCGLFSSSAYGAWYNPSWVYRQEITILPALADSNLSGFPYLVKITDAANPVFANALSNGDDIVFTSSDGSTKLAHELEKYDSTTNELYAWVRVPSISSTAGAVIYMYYDNGSVTASEEDVEGTWDNDFVDVQHLQETTGTHFDSTSNNNDGTPLNGVIQNATGRIDGANRFDGSNDKVDTADSASLRVVEMTVEAWVYVPSSIPSGYHGIVVHAPSTSNWYGLWNNSNRFHFRWSTGSVRRTDFTGTFSPDQWYYVAGVLDVGADKAFTYQNDNLDTTINGPSAPTQASGPLYIGHTFGPSEFFQGFIDEVRISRIARSDAWIKASARNQGTPDTYQSLAPEETEGSSSTISGTVLEDVNGDSGLGDAVGVGNVRVRLYEDVNDNGVVDAGDLYSADTLTAAVTGAYSFSVSTGTNFLVAVDSKTVTPSGGFNIGAVQSEVWSEQTYGDNSVTAALDLGARVGGRNSTTPDDVDPVLTLPTDNEYQHLARVDVSGGNVTGVNFAFSFNVISNTLDGADVDTLNPRTRQGTLRQFVQNANAILNPNAATVPVGTYNLSIAGTGENEALTGDLDITDNLTLNGAGAGSTIIDGNGIDRVFHVLEGPTLTISNVTIRDGDAAGNDGGGIWNESNLTLSNVTMSNNSAGNGGAIFSERNPNSLTLTNVTLNGNSATSQGGAIGMTDDNASLTFTDVTMSGNSAVSEGGAFFGERASGTMTRVIVTGNGSQDGAGLTILNGASNITLTDVTVSSNTASRRGGGVLVDSATTTFNRVTVDGNSCTSERGGGLHFRGGGLANLTNVTISGNTCDEGGGIYVDGGTANLTNVTLNANGAPGGGGGLRRGGGTVTILNTIVANSTTGGNCSGTIVSSGNNLDSANTCLLAASGDLINSNPNLGSLANNGGLTETHALPVGSPAIDSGTNIGCPATDQRGVGRPIGGTCDIGAYEGISASTVISGTVLEDVNGDSGLGDAVGVGNVRVRLYDDVNDNGVVDAGDLYSAETLTAAVTGAYSFSASAGTKFLVAVDSKTVTPSGGFNIGAVQSEVWSEQSYGDNSVTAALDLGARIGGRSPTTPDDVDPVLTLPADNEYQHLARVDVSGGNVTGVDFAFSFNVISNTLDGADVDLANLRTRQGTLRQFVQNANAILNPNTVTVPAGTYNLSIAGTGENEALTGDLDITDNLTLNGAGAGSTIIDGNGIDRVFHVLEGPTLTISNVTIRDGDAGGNDGGGIWNESNLTLSNVTMSNNSAADGGAIFSERNPNSLTLSNVTLTGNSATNNGGAIGMKDDNASLTFLDVTMTGNTAAKIGGGFYGEKASGSLTRVTATGNDSEDGAGLTILNGASNITLTDVTVSSNTASRRGGGVLVDSATTTFNRVTVDGNSCTSERGGGLHFRNGGLANLTNVTISGNTCNEGGGIYVEGGHNVNLTNVTLNANGAPGGGGGLRRNGGTLTILNTIVANSTSGGNCSGTIVSSGNNLDSANTCLLAGSGDLINSNPNLGSLANNGGLTETHALGSGSAAIDSGTNAGVPTTDQRGVARGFDGDGTPNSPVSGDYDIGAYEAPLFDAANLALTKTDSPDPVSVGNAFTYTLTATNNGPTDATNVTLVDTLPADVDWQSATPSQGNCVHSGEPLGGTVTCTLGTIANGANATVDIDVVAPNTTGVISNSATVSADEADPDSSDNTAVQDTTIIDPSANLSVTQVEDFDPAGVNLPFVYTVTVTNPGPADATLVTLVDTLDGAVTFQTVVPSQGSCAEAGGVVTCDLGALASGSSATIDIAVTAPATPQTVTNTAVVSAAEPDSDVSDNTSLEDTDVINPPPTDLELTMVDSPDPVVGGNPLTYTLTINNLGPGPATVVQLTDTLPAGATFVSATPSSGTCSEAGGVVDCSFTGAISDGASENVVIVITAPAVPGLMTNNASVSTARIDPNVANDSASAGTEVTIIGEADLSLSMSDSPDPVSVAQPLSYSVLVDNLGPDDAIDVVLVDTLPATVAFQSVITGQGSCVHSGEPLGGTVTCTLGTIASTANAMVDIVVTAPPSAGSITNNASVSASSVDSDPADDNASEITTVQNLNVNQLCYLVADAGGGGGGNDLLTQIDTADFSPLTNETNIGIGTGTNTIEAIAWNSATGVLYGANGGRLGTLSTTTGVFTALPSSFGTGSGALGNITFTDVDGLTFDAMTGILYGSERQSGTDVLIQINMATGAHVPNAFGDGIDYVPMPPILGNSLTDDIAVDPTTGIMYAAVNSGGSTDRLIRVNKTTGATTDVALITVPDIEGLGTDSTGQLWGTSGTQRILYELNKATGVGSNGRPINNGSDYESIDCYAFSPSVIADLGVTKTVDDAAPVESDTVIYTVTATNTGPGVATVVQLSDVLPAGVSFVSAIPSQGTYDSSTGAWFVGTLNSGNNATLNIQASADLGTAGTTITNTASVTFASQYDPNTGNNTGSADIIPEAGVANLTVLKSVSTLRDPLGAVAPAALAIPGATVQYEISVTNSGTGTATEVIVSDTLNANISFATGEFNGGAADIEIIVGAAAPVFCIAEVGGDTNTDGCFLNAAGDDLTVTIPVSATYPTGLTVGTTAPNNVAVVHFRVTVK